MWANLQTNRLFQIYPQKSLLVLVLVPVLAQEVLAQVLE
jgi:hypothetical protein